MRFRHVQLAAGAETFARQGDFYANTLGLPVSTTEDGITVTIGETELEFTPTPGVPFYHFAFLIPGDRYDAALHWIGQRTRLLPHRDTDDPVFEFPNWDAHACYFHDPAGNIVELISHRDIDRNGRTAQFEPQEMLGLSELGLPGRPTTMAPSLTGALNLEVWDGRVVDHDGLAFVGSKARTLILVPAGRGWLPTGRPAELHPVTACLDGPPENENEAEATLEGGLYRITQRPANPRG